MGALLENRQALATVYAVLGDNILESQCDVTECDVTECGVNGLNP